MHTTVARLARSRITAPKPKTTKTVRTSRSSLVSHSFPAFYACYLLKSVRSPQAKATYIGISPDPLRRLREHNELARGAKKTKAKRPWVMQMLVHGFPSKVSALQFEGAWHNPVRSRHLRGLGFTRRPASVRQQVEVVQMMINRHPYNLWPLHAKLFTPEVVKHWVDTMLSNRENDPHTPPFPRGFKYTIELEGVDGQSGAEGGSGRQGPIDITDKEFTSSFLAKNTALLASNTSISCSICHEALPEYANDPLSTVLCPAPGCMATSHMLCLSKQFLASDESRTSNLASLVPRGGTCQSCGTYTLWGEIIKGSYRRKLGSSLEAPEVDEDQDPLGASAGEDGGLQDGSHQSQYGVKGGTSKRRGSKTSAREGAKGTRKIKVQGTGKTSIDGKHGTATTTAGESTEVKKKPRTKGKSVGTTTKRARKTAAAGETDLGKGTKKGTKKGAKETKKKGTKKAKIKKGKSLEDPGL